MFISETYTIWLRVVRSPLLRRLLALIQIKVKNILIYFIIKQYDMSDAGRFVYIYISSTSSHITYIRHRDSR